MSLSLRMVRRYIEEGRLYSLNTELTYRCPLNCHHCYQKGYQSDELSTGDWLSVFDDARTLGVFNLGLSGGEVLGRQDLPELLAGGSERGFRLFIKTSGNGASKASLKALAAARPAQVDVSFYSADGSTHDRATGQPGSFAQSLQFVRYLANEGLYVRGVLTPLKGFTDSPLETRDALHRLGVSRVVWNLVKPSLCDDPDRVSGLVPDGGGETDIVSAESASGGKIGDTICGASSYSLQVRPDGRVSPCHAIEEVVGDLKVQRLTDIWANSPSLERFRERRRAQLPRCRTCPDWESCRYCPAEATKVSGDWRKPAPGFCHRMEAIDGEEE